MGKCVIKTGGAGGTGSDECTATKAQVMKGATAVTADSDDESAEGTLEIQSVINFSVAQYANLTLIASWALPVSGPWSGIRIMCKQGSYPADTNDGTLFYEGGSISATKSLAAGVWYFRIWNYMMTNYGRIYGNCVDASASNNPIQGQQVFTSSGVFTVPMGVQSVDIFLVGGGASGNAASGSMGPSVWHSGGGGGGSGYTNTVKKIAVSPSQQIAVVIGAGGSGVAFDRHNNNSGSASSFGAYVAAGGSAVTQYEVRKGSNGGSGGGAAYAKGYSGGTDGGRGEDGYGSEFGNGQGRTTRAFGEAGNTLYAGGGGGGFYYYCGSGGAGGGGAGGAGYDDSGYYDAFGTPGTASTGGGGGGIAYSEKGRSGAGGSGIAIIRWGY